MVGGYAFQISKKELEKMTNQTAFEISNNAAMQRAIDRARKNANKSRARVISAEERIYSIKSANSDKTYTVKFFVAGSKKLACCQDQNGELCKGLSQRSVCYHVAIAAGINIGLRQQMELEKAKAAINAAPVAEITYLNAFCDVCPNQAFGEGNGLRRAGWFLGQNEQFCPTCND